MRKKRCLVLFAALCVPLVAAGLLFLRTRRPDPSTTSWERLDRFLYATDYRALRVACADVITNRHSYRQLAGHWTTMDGKPGLIFGPDSPLVLDPSDTSLPEILRKFNPATLVVTPCRLVAHFHHGPPGCVHHGFTVFLDENNITDTTGAVDEMLMLQPEGYPDGLLVPNDEFWLNVIPHLWYFDRWLNQSPHCFKGGREELTQILKRQVAKQNGNTGNVEPAPAVELDSPRPACRCPAQ